MKKKLEAELISIAHRILKLKNKSDLIQLHQETQKLYEKLSVLRFVEEHFGDAKPTIGQTETIEKIEAALEAEPQIEEVNEAPAEPESLAEVAAVVDSPAVVEQIAAENGAEENETATEEAQEESVEITENPEEETQEEITAENSNDSEQAEETEETPIEEPETQEETETPVEEETAASDDSLFKPAFELSFEPKSEAPKEEIKEDAKEEFKSENAQITFEDILGSSYVDPVFVKPEDLEQERREPAKSDNVIPIGRNFSDGSPVISINKTDDSRSYSLNDRLSKGITIGLNDRVAFMKHLFNNSSEDYNRVLSQLITFDTFAEAQNFIDNMVKPDYNNWEGKDEYAERFMEIVEKKFS